MGTTDGHQWAVLLAAPGQNPLALDTPDRKVGASASAAHASHRNCPPHQSSSNPKLVNHGRNVPSRSTTIIGARISISPDMTCQPVTPQEPNAPYIHVNGEGRVDMPQNEDLQRKPTLRQGALLTSGHRPGNGTAQISQGASDKESDATHLTRGFRALITD